LKTITVVGGGITGLSTMFELHKWKKETGADIRLLLIEAQSHLGGKIKTKKNQEFVMETGADSIVARKTHGMSFIGDLELENDLVYNDTGRSFIFTDEGLKPIPTDSIFGIPLSIESLAKSTLVSAEGKVEALKDLYNPNNGFTKGDSIGDFLEACFGKELVEKQIGPVLSGVYSGALSELTIQSTLPYLLDYKEEYGSIIRGLEANKQKFQSSGEKKFFSFKDGMETLVKRYENKLDDIEIYKDTKVINIEKKEKKYQILLSNQEIIQSDYVVLSTPSMEAENLLPELKDYFAPLKNSSLISIYMGYNLSDLQLPEEGTGFITSSTNDLVCNACTRTSRKWRHTSKNGNILIRLFYKSNLSDYAHLKEMNREEIILVAKKDIEKSLGLFAEPVVTELTYWNNSMPNYLISHPQTVQNIENRLSEVYPGILIAGSSYYGVGIPDCIDNGTKTARKLIELL
jgi:protoporphyrinogen/coproporphyrinogen III oxidase